MGAPKQKWTPEEEAALRAGVEKYGPGKWRHIQKDAKFGPSLTSRSNVDLKDKWRNMSVSSNGHASRDRSSKPLALTAATDLLSLGLEDPNPLGLASPDGLADGKSMILADPEFMSGKLLGPRFDEFVMEAIRVANDRNGSNSGAIATYIEEHHPVPTNFRRLLTAKLKQLSMEGKLVKLRQNYKISNSETSPPSINGAKPAKLRPMRGHDTDAELKHSPRFPREATKKARGNFGVKKAQKNVDLARARMKNAQEAARAAAQAVAEAEAAATAAELAAREAEAAEQEAEAAEAAAEAAQAAIRPPKKAKLVYNFPEANAVEA